MTLLEEEEQGLLLHWEDILVLVLYFVLVLAVGFIVSFAEDCDGFKKSKSSQVSEILFCVLYIWHV